MFMVVVRGCNVLSNDELTVLLAHDVRIEKRTQIVEEMEFMKNKIR